MSPCATRDCGKMYAKLYTKGEVLYTKGEKLYTKSEFLYT